MGIEDVVAEEKEIVGISKIEQTILYLMAEAVVYERDNADERVVWANDLLKKIDSCSTRDIRFK